MKIVIDASKCCGTGRCILVCPQRAISMQGGKAAVDHVACDLDGICIPACPKQAITLAD